MSFTKFDYLLNAFEQASQSPEPAKMGYGGKRRALLAYVNELESRASIAETQRSSSGARSDEPKAGGAPLGSEPEGVFGKYVLRKSSGKPLDPEACYFVLRLDTDEAARYAAMEYARRCDNRQLAHDLTACVAELRAPCSCRSVGDECRRHPMFSSVWKAGASPSAGTGEPTK